MHSCHFVNAEKAQGQLYHVGQNESSQMGRSCLAFGMFLWKVCRSLWGKKKRVSSIGVNVIRSPFPCVRGFGRGEAKCEDAGEGNKYGTGWNRTSSGTGSQRPWRGNEGKAGRHKRGQERESTWSRSQVFLCDSHPHPCVHLLSSSSAQG